MLCHVLDGGVLYASQCKEIDYDSGQCANVKLYRCKDTTAKVIFISVDIKYRTEAILRSFQNRRNNRLCL